MFLFSYFKFSIFVQKIASCTYCYGLPLCVCAISSKNNRKSFKFRQSGSHNIPPVLKACQKKLDNSWACNYPRRRARSSREHLSGALPTFYFIHNTRSCTHETSDLFFLGFFLIVWHISVTQRESGSL